MTHPRAGQQADQQDLIDVDAVVAAYTDRIPDLENPDQLVSFGTSGHRGASLDGSFNESHIAAISLAIAEYRKTQRINGPLFLGRDTHALSEPAWRTAIEVLTAADVPVLIDNRDGYTPTPAVSHAILRHNRTTSNSSAYADGIVVTPSHNPPRDGGFKYNPPHGGPADSAATSWIQDRANSLLRQGVSVIPHLAWEQAKRATHRYDFLSQYVSTLPDILDLDLIRSAGVRIGADPMGGASVAYWQEIADHHRLDLTVVNPTVDPQWPFMTVDWDGKIRMDCSSPYAMAALVAARGEYQIATGNDADSDRHGIVTPDAGLMNPNHFLCAAIAYLFTSRSWHPDAMIGKTAVTSSLVNRIAASFNRGVMETPVGFKWFAEPLITGQLGFAGEESAGASFLCRDGSAWSSDKDGIVLALLASELTAATGTSPSEYYRNLTDQFGTPEYTRVDAPANRAQKAALAALTASAVSASELAGDPIRERLTHASGNNAAIDGLKVTTEHAWFAARPSGTENVYKIYAESFRGADHLNEVLTAARQLVDDCLPPGDPQQE
ncbi:MAG: phosphoglucomutase (alpha-D-glucose-1,6-bisphosphate-dependent) [Actinomycetota bacterium]